MQLINSMPVYIVFSCVFLLFTLYRTISYSRQQQYRAATELDTASVQDRGGSRLIEITYTGVYAAAFYGVSTASAPVWLVCGGLFFMLIAWYVRQKALNDLGQNYGHEIKLFKKHELVQKGIYSHMRHPLYFGLIVDTFGAVLIASSPFGVFFFITFILVVFRRISHEDRALVDHFGEEAEKYHKRVAAIPLWPF